jgi:hypothetical protein
MKDLKNFIKTTIREYLNEYKQILLAPNGKPSNLPKSLYAYVRSDEFKNWFGDWENNPNKSSKVVDKNGEPLIVWHGTHTKKEFEFDDGFDTKGGESYGSHFGTKKSAMDRLNDLYSEMFYQGNARLIPVFIDIKNPKFLHDYNLNEYMKAELDGYDGIIYTNEIEDKGSIGYAVFNKLKIKPIKNIK